LQASVAHPTYSREIPKSTSGNVAIPSHKPDLREAVRQQARRLFTRRRKENLAALFDAVCELEIEGVVAKRLTGHHRPGERKIKNRDYCRYEVERESAINKCRQRVFV
jgi:hypothetical protein